MEAESAFPSPLSDFEAERLTSGVELPQSPTQKFENLGIGEGNEDGELTNVALPHNSGLALFGFRAFKYYAPEIGRAHV